MRHPKVLRIIEYEIKRLSAGLSQYERIGKFRLLPHEFSLEAGELTPTLKFRREVICKRYADLIEAMYSET